ncbi:MAG: HPr family phosphocarrier protein [Verrucomicrobia bacterium]|nr:HPr family phosphocarrier protein [Verrucomicrobiota bacterium]NMD21783.1 HPr family phosphocarrier protein [Verrucomicrobiota bacterium]
MSATKTPEERRKLNQRIDRANRLGIHARPAAMFVKTANRFAYNRAQARCLGSLAHASASRLIAGAKPAFSIRVPALVIPWFRSGRTNDPDATRSLPEDCAAAASISVRHCDHPSRRETRMRADRIQ